MALFQRPEPRPIVPLPDVRSPEQVTRPTPVPRPTQAIRPILEPGDLADIEEWRPRQVRAEERAASLSSVARAIARRWFVVLVVAALVIAGDFEYTRTRVPTYQAQATFAISPSASMNQNNLVDGIDALGRGAIIGTMVNVLGSAVVQREVLQQMGVSTDALNHQVFFTVSNVASTAVVLETVESTDPQLSADLANLAGTVAMARLANLYPVYSLTVLSPAVPPTDPFKPDKTRNYALGGVFGVVLGMAMAFIADEVLRRRGSGRPRAAKGSA